MLLKKLLKLIIKKGKKNIAVKSLNKTIKVMGKYIPPSVLNNIVTKKLAPLVKIYKKKVAGKVYQLPWRITPNRSIFQAAKWIMLGVEAEKRGRDLSVKIGKQLTKILKGKGLPMKLRGQFLDIIKENRSYMRFIRHKRIKRKTFNKGKFKNRFSKKSVSFRLREIIWEKKHGKKNNKKFSSKNKKHRR